MKISFDYDGVLSEVRYQKLASKFISEGHDVYITTSRFEEESRLFGCSNKKLKVIASNLGITEDKIRYTNGGDKYPLLEDFDIHFDDNQVDIELIEENLEFCNGVLIYDP